MPNPESKASLSGANAPQSPKPKATRGRPRIGVGELPPHASKQAKAGCRPHLTITIDPETYTRLDAYCATENVSRGHAVDRAVLLLTEKAPRLTDFQHYDDWSQAWEEWYRTCHPGVTPEKDEVEESPEIIAEKES